MSGSRLVVVVAIAGPLLWVLGTTLFSAHSFVYRDAAHYYYPLYEHTARQWSAGRVPLWNGQENSGVPMLADTTSAVCYPGKLIFALPGLSYPARYKLYIATHLVLAAVLAYLLARQWRASVLASGACGLSYAMCGNVLFQTCNVVFLVGAAWLPASLWAVDRLLTERRAKWALVLGAVLALMTLGGDPQAAYHTGLLAVLYAWLLWRGGNHLARREYTAGEVCCGPSLGPRDVWPHTTGPRRVHRGLMDNRLILLLAAAASGIMLAAVQILPSLEWTRHSGRAAYEAPRTIYEIPTSLAFHQKHGNFWTGLAGRPAAGTHAEQLYHFSVGPWRLVELLWPNFSGRPFPVNRRWLNIVPAEGRLWTPSLYMGLIPLLLAASSFRLRRGKARTCWLSWSVLLAVLGSFGWYGVGWIIEEACVAWDIHQAGQSTVGPPVGGLYWLMSVLLPGYVYFRYPAKLLVVAALGASLLTAQGWDQVIGGQARGIRRTLLGLGALSLVAVMILMAVRPLWPDWLSSVKADELFGPLHSSAAWGQLIGSMLHTALLCGLFWWLLGKASGSRGAPGWQAAILLAAACDLAIAQAWMAPGAPQHTWQQKPRLASVIGQQETRHGHDWPARVFRASGRQLWPARWNSTSSPDRQRAGLAWDHDTLLGKYHLATGLSLVESSGTIRSHDYRVFLEVARRHGPLWPDGTRGPHRAVLDALGVRYLILPKGMSLASTQPVSTQSTPEAELENVVLWYNPHHLSRAWIVHRWEELPPLDSTAPAAVRRRTERVLFPQSQVRDLRHQAVVEAKLPPAHAALPRDIPIPPSEACRIVTERPSRVEIQADLTRAGLVVLSDLYYPGWRARVETTGLSGARPAKIVRTNRVMRGVYLPPGRHRLIFCYRPWSFYLGAAISGVSWCVLLLASLLAWRRKTNCGRAAVPSPR